jgi:hypothetical protein
MPRYKTAQQLEKQPGSQFIACICFVLASSLAVKYSCTLYAISTITTTWTSRNNTLAYLEISALNTINKNMGRMHTRFANHQACTYENTYRRNY